MTTTAEKRIPPTQVKHTMRANGDGELKVEHLTARKAIQQFCRECVGFNADEVKRCTDDICPLYPFRLHTKPKGTLKVS